MIPGFAKAPEAAWYEESDWKPRAVLPAADALGNKFWPDSPKEDVNFDDPAFVASRLRPAPPPGVYPRVLLTPGDVEEIRAKVAMGANAPEAFRVMWERERRKHGAFYALVAEDATLGRVLADELVAKMHALGPKLDAMDARPDRENLWAVERSTVASGDPDPPVEIWALLDYDYLHRWMTPDERAFAEKLIGRITRGRVSNFMVKPDHFLMNNHKMFGMEFLRLLMLIEGTREFDRAVYEAASHKARVMLDYYLYPAGNCFESIKGWLNNSVYVALARRHPDLLKHSRLRAKMDFFRQALRWEDGRWVIREEMRASAFHVIWMMRYFRPDDPLLDWLYAATFSTHDFLKNPDARWPDPVGINSELLLLFAEDGMKGPDGKPVDWSDPARVLAADLPLTWVDDRGGNMIARNSWRPDDLALGFSCKQDFFYGGHEGSETNRIVLWKDGINWVRDSDLLAVKATFLQNMLTIDGRGLDWPPAPGVWLGVEDAPGGVIASGDGKMAYDFSKVMQVHPLDFPSAQLPYYRPFAEGNFDLTRDHQIAFHPGTVAWNDGYAHTDYGPWSGETRLVESYKTNNPVEKAYRTVYMARGKHPYVLVVDDARKDDKDRLYEFNLTIPSGIDLLDAKGDEVLFQSVPPGGGRENDLLLGLASTPRNKDTGVAEIKKGDPLFLVRTLWRNSPHGFPVPGFSKFPVEPHKPYGGLGHVSIPAISDSPEFRVLLYPHRHGDPVPGTRWNEDRTELTVRLGDDTDVIRFGTTDGGRTVFSVERNGKPVVNSDAPPARPRIEVRGEAFDAAALRGTRFENDVPRHPFDRGVRVELHGPPAPACIVYTMDGSEPGADSPRYEKPLLVIESTRLKARVIDPGWTAGPQQSAVVEADFVKTDAAVGRDRPPSGSEPGLRADVYEKKTVMWDARGFFHADKIMLPDLDREKPVLTTVTPGFVLPHVVPARPVREQTKGFYRFRGWFHAEERGVHTFSVDSTGPVLLTVAGREVIANRGVFHQQQAVRSGAVALDSGWHEIGLVVTDPLFWNMSTLDPMPFSVSVRVEDGMTAPVAGSLLRHAPVEITAPAEAPVPKITAVAPPLWLEPGAEVAIYDRAGKLLDPDFLDIDALEPLQTGLADRFEPNPSPGFVREYRGWLYAPESGEYLFELPAKAARREHLSNLRGAFQNQLRIGDAVVAQRGVAGRVAPGKAHLEAGWHPVSLRLGSSTAQIWMTGPDHQRRPLAANLLHRPSRLRIGPTGAASSAAIQEIFEPTEAHILLPGGRNGTIRFTMDGSEPTAASPEYVKPLRIDRDVKIRAAAFLPDGSTAAESQTAFRLVNVPETGLIASARFKEWDGKHGTTPLDSRSKVWTDSRTSPENGVLVFDPLGRKLQPAVDINVSRPVGKAAVKVSQMRMAGDALTVGLWFRSDSPSGRLFGKDGLTAFGKRHRTVSARIEGGRIVAAPGGLASEKITPGTWNHVVLTADPVESRLYLNGREVARGEGSKDIATDALDFLDGHAAALGEFRIYERVLSPDEVARWHKATRGDFAR